MDECQLKGLCCNCDDKYFLEHKFKEQIFFVVIYEDVVDEEAEVSHVEEIP
jgi:hypothetical protein